MRGKSDLCTTGYRMLRTTGLPTSFAARRGVHLRFCACCCFSGCTLCRPRFKGSSGCVPSGTCCRGLRTVAPVGTDLLTLGRCGTFLPSTVDTFDGGKGAITSDSARRDMGCMSTAVRSRGITRFLVSRFICGFMSGGKLSRTSKLVILFHGRIGSTGSVRGFGTLYAG